MLYLDDEWASRIIPNPGSDGDGEDNKEAEYGIAYRLHEELLVLLHITRSGNRGTDDKQTPPRVCTERRPPE